MAERLRLARERSKQRKELLKYTLGVDDLSAALGSSPIQSEPKPVSSVTGKNEPCSLISKPISVKTTLIDIKKMLDLLAYNPGINSNKRFFALTAMRE